MAMMSSDFQIQGANEIYDVDYCRGLFNRYGEHKLRSRSISNNSLDEIVCLETLERKRQDKGLGAG